VGDKIARLKAKVKTYSRMQLFGWFLFLFIRYTIIYVFAWQLDILCANLVYPVRFEIFYFWGWQLTKWDAYALFFWGYAFGTLWPEIVYITKNVCSLLYSWWIK